MLPGCPGLRFSSQRGSGGGELNLSFPRSINVWCKDRVEQFAAPLRWSRGRFWEGCARILWKETRLLEASHCLPCRCQGNWRRERPLPPPHLTDVSAKPAYLSGGTWTSARGYLLLLFSLWVEFDSCKRMDCSSPGSTVFVTLWTVAHQVPLSMGFSRQELWTGLLFPSPGYHHNPGIISVSLVSSALARGFFTTEPPGKPKRVLRSWSVSFLTHSSSREEKQLIWWWDWEKELRWCLSAPPSVSFEWIWYISMLNVYHYHIVNF